jgi:hypothetical protein
MMSEDERLKEVLARIAQKRNELVSGIVGGVTMVKVRELLAANRINPNLFKPKTDEGGDANMAGNI